MDATEAQLEQHDDDGAICFNCTEWNLALASSNNFKRHQQSKSIKAKWKLEKRCLQLRITASIAVKKHEQTMKHQENVYPEGWTTKETIHSRFSPVIHRLYLQFWRPNCRWSNLLLQLPSWQPPRPLLYLAPDLCILIYALAPPLGGQRRRKVMLPWQISAWCISAGVFR